MDSGVKIKIIGIIILFSISISYGKMMKFQCSSSVAECVGLDMSCPGGEEPIIMCPHSTFDPTNPKPSCVICSIECARECARLANCLDDPSTAINECDSCCSNYCIKYSDYKSEACNGMCNAICRGNSEFCQIIKLLQFLSMGVGIILLSINAIRWMMSDSEKARNDAKKGISYTISALIIIIIATYLVSYFYVGTITC